MDLLGRLGVATSLLGRELLADEGDRRVVVVLKTFLEVRVLLILLEILDGERGLDDVSEVLDGGSGSEGGDETVASDLLARAVVGKRFVWKLHGVKPFVEQLELAGVGRRSMGGLEECPSPGAGLAFDKATIGH